MIPPFTHTVRRKNDITGEYEDFTTKTDWRVPCAYCKNDAGTGPLKARMNVVSWGPRVKGKLQSPHGRAIPENPNDPAFRRLFPYHPTTQEFDTWKSGLGWCKCKGPEDQLVASARDGPEHGDNNEKRVYSSLQNPKIITIPDPRPDAKKGATISVGQWHSAHPDYDPQAPVVFSKKGSKWTGKAMNTFHRWCADEEDAIGCADWININAKITGDWDRFGPGSKRHVETWGEDLSAQEEEE